MRSCVVTLVLVTLVTTLTLGTNAMVGVIPTMAAGLTAGGLTAVPQTTFSANLAENGGFESSAGGVPTDGPPAQVGRSIKQ